MNTRSYTLAWVVEHMPKESNDALIKFTERNPHWQGAHWDDCLDTIMDADGHLELTEALCEYTPTSPWSMRLVSAVGITLLYASQAFAEATIDQQWIMVDATIRNNGGGL